MSLYLNVFDLLATNRSKENNSTAAVRLMHENIEIKREILKISKEKLLLQREEFEYLKNIHSGYKDILSNMDYNIMRLREKVEKIAPLKSKCISRIVVKYLKD